MGHPLFISTNRLAVRTDVIEEMFADDQFNDGRLSADEIQCVVIDADGHGAELKTSDECFKYAQEYMIENKKNCLFFCHGFANTWEDAIKAARALSDLYDVVVIMFTWPSGITGAPFEDYREKKKYAMKSCGAMDRTLGKLHKLIKTSPLDCDLKISALFHSMANYLWQGNILSQGHYYARKQLFDNIIYAQPDVNAHTFKDVIEKVDVRCNQYVTINCKDKALFASTLKVGKAQKKRRGNTTKYLDGECIYLDFTSKVIGREHTFFKGFKDNKNVETIHDLIVNGCESKADLSNLLTEVIPEKLYRVF